MIIIAAVALGIVFGIFVFPAEWLGTTDYIMDVGLCVLLILVGIDIGKQKGIFDEVKKLGADLIMVPLMIGLGSIVGGIMTSVLLGMSLNEGGAVGAGFGWYSLSAVILSDYSNELSAMAFLTNVLRELFAILLLPLIAKHIGHEEAIAPCGATAMDTTLPIITRYTSPRISVLAFTTGLVLSMAVPVLVPLIIGL